MRIKKCPFCYGEADLFKVQGKHEDYYFISCIGDNDCFHPKTGMYEDENDAKDSWNKRKKK